METSEFSDIVLDGDRIQWMASPAQVAVLVLLVFLVVYFAIRLLKLVTAGREKFASKRAHRVYNQAQRAFLKSGGDARYSDFKKEVADADPVLYSDVRQLFKQNRLSPDSVENVL